MSIMKSLPAMAVTLLFLLPDIATTFDALHKCKYDVDCPKNTNQFCRGDICHDCVKCASFHRNTGLRTNCLRDETECGRCFDGSWSHKNRYREVINGHPPYGKQCEVQRSAAPHVDTFGGDSRQNRRGSLGKAGHGSETPNRTAEIGVIVAVAVFAVAFVVGIMSGLYHYLRKRRLQMQLPTDDKTGPKEPPRIVEMQNFPITAKSQQVTRRQESVDVEFKAIPIDDATTDHLLQAHKERGAESERDLNKNLNYN